MSSQKFLDKMLLNEDSGIVAYEDINADTKKVCDYIITQVKQLGVGIEETKKGNGIFDRNWFKEEIKEIKIQLEELTELHQIEIQKD